MGKINSSNAWVFISHSNKDFDKIIHVRNKLEALHYKPLLFFLKCLDDDKEIFELIKREIQARDRFILCDSKNSREYEWVQKEKDFIISLNRPYEIINLDGTDVEIDESIKRFNQRSTIYIWSTDDKINEFVAKNFIDKAYRVELLYNNYLKEYYLYKTGSPDLVSDDFHEVIGNGYVLLIISRELSAKENFYIDQVASRFRLYTNNCCLYITSKESMANYDLYNDLRNADGIQPRIVCPEALADRNDMECANKIVADLVALDNYHYQMRKNKEL